MALFGFLKKKPEETMLEPPKPPSGTAPLPPLTSLDNHLPKPSPITATPSTTPTLQSLPPLNAPRTVSSLPPLPPVEAKPPMPALPPMPAPAPLPPLPKPATPSLPPMPSKPITPIPSVMKPATGVPPPPAFAPAARPAIDAFAAPKPVMPTLPTLPVAKPVTPVMPALPPSKPVTPAIVPQPTLPSLADLPKISVKENTKPVDPFSLPPAPAAQAPPKIAETARAPEPLKRENSKLAKVLEELSMDDFSLPALTPMQHPAPAPAFQPQLSREPMRSLKKGKSYVALQNFEEAAGELHGTEQHLHNLQVHNEKLGIIETHTKNELDTLVTVFEIMQRHLLSIDDKLFAEQGE